MYMYIGFLEYEEIWFLRAGAILLFLSLVLYAYNKLLTSKATYTEEELRKDKEYCLRKLGLSEEEFEEMMNLPVRSHFDYDSDIKWRIPLRYIYRMLGGSRY